MKRIISIQLENYRAFHNIFKEIAIPKGQNVLIYGENGSGKSSLFKALNDYINSSRIARNFTINRYSQNPRGKIEIKFSDFTSNPWTEIPNTAQSFIFSDTNTPNQIGFLQVASLAKGFLEYRDLLDVYLHKEARPNLFNLVVQTLLANYIPNNLGATYRVGARWGQLQNLLIDESYTRRDYNHQYALNELVIYERNLRSTLDDIFSDLNQMLTTYFTDLNIQLSYDLAPLDFLYGNGKWEWKTRADLRLNVIKDGVVIIGDYSDILNEARLSAFAICLYLASLKRNPVVDYQILYLDDIFVGLDAGNRLPILKIIEAEFQGYQVFISTYDRHWYELASRYFKKSVNNNWLAFEFYVGKGEENAITFDKPIITKGESNFEKAVKYLNHNTDPDYPAAGNNFRKYLEELLPKYIPIIELTDANKQQLADFKTTKIIQLSISFLKRTFNNATSLESIYSLLHGLVHPLSHYSIKGPVYKGELLIVERSIMALESQLIALDWQNNYKAILEKGKTIKLTFCVDQATNHYFYYEISLKSNLWIKNIPGQVPIICNTGCHAVRYYGHNGTVLYPPGRANRNHAYYNYETLETAYNNIYQFLNNTQVAFPMSQTGYLSWCEWAGPSGWEPLGNLIVWP
ncbi:AAA family ATPase [Pedobacter alluvionis]|uniref:AAA domain-containing protein n=1 Tax=Pedobacter alluvionis TaxID=475253 RepID=A0A497Y0F7_9SPHI|nr:AAA family ATPase [Pedobacter alluvionis]RLJ75136.1 AAA domain-containing protein [Pedobacter alluvionis]